MTTVAKVQDKNVSLNGLSFHYRDWGSETAPPLVLLHGITSHSRTWDRFASTMTDRFRVLALDQRGHGETDWAPRYSTKLMAEDLAAFAAALGLGRFALVGHSMGACNAYYVAAQNPKAVDRLVIGDFGPDVVGSTAGGQVAARIQAAATASFADAEEAVRSAVAQNPRAAEADVRHRVSANLKQRDDGRWVWRYDGAGLAAHAPVDRMPSREEQWQMIARIACPTLIVRGAESDTLQRATAERMLEVIPDCRLIEVARAGHSIPLDNPVGWLAAVRPFLLEGL
ncbi:MAG TPA: alpha/beta hydrolase [Dehalococcoidia bacterium]|nr:alpha/beta hydrolase [Dehalococcoidia bacterium]